MKHKKTITTIILVLLFLLAAQTIQASDSSSKITLNEGEKTVWAVKTQDYISGQWDFYDNGKGEICYTPKTDPSTGEVTEFHNDLADNKISVSDIKTKYFSEEKSPGKSLSIV